MLVVLSSNGGSFVCFGRFMVYPSSNSVGDKEGCIYIKIVSKRVVTGRSEKFYLNKQINQWQ
jgi:hypothetical protein